MNTLEALAEAMNLCDTCTMGSNFVGFCPEKMTQHLKCKSYMKSEKIKRQEEKAKNQIKVDLQACMLYNSCIN